MSNRSQNTSEEPPAIGGLLRMAWQLHFARIYERIQAAGYTDVTPGQFQLFRWPGMDGRRPSEMAQRTGLSKQAVNDLIGELERNGYVERHRDPDDARARLLQLTARGAKLQRRAHEISRELEAAWAAAIGQERFDALRATLTEMVERGLPDEVPGP